MGTLEALGVILGTLLLAAGVVVVATNYSEAYSCTYDLQCHDQGGTEPTVADRGAAALGFGSEQSSESDLPGPEGTLLLAAGAALLLFVLVMHPERAHEPVTGIRPEADAPPPPRPVAVDDPGPRRRVFLDR